MNDPGIRGRLVIKRKKMDGYTLMVLTERNQRTGDFGLVKADNPFLAGKRGACISIKIKIF